MTKPTEKQMRAWQEVGKVVDTRDIVERLLSRAWEDRHHRKYREEAAAEIQRLRAERDALKLAQRDVLDASQATLSHLEKQEGEK